VHNHAVTSAYGSPQSDRVYIAEAPPVLLKKKKILAVKKSLTLSALKECIKSWSTSKKRYKQLTKLLVVVVVGPNQEAVVGVGSSSGSGHHHPNQKLTLKMEFIESNAV